MSSLIAFVLTLLLSLGFYFLIRFLNFESLLIADLRTLRLYRMPIKHNAVRAAEFQKISPLGVTASRQEHAAKGLVMLDPGFKNTAVKESTITYMYDLQLPTVDSCSTNSIPQHYSDGYRGVLQYRQYSIGYLFAHNDYEDVLHLLVWGSLPTLEAKTRFRSQVAKCMVPPPSVIDVVRSFR